MKPIMRANTSTSNELRNVEKRPSFIMKSISMVFLSSDSAVGPISKTVLKFQDARLSHDKLHVRYAPTSNYHLFVLNIGACDAF